MPVRAPRICSCGKVVPSGQRCQCQREKARAYDAQRGTAAQRGYTGSWRKASAAFLALPGNERCACGCGRIANMVDHRIAPKGDQGLFWDRSNWRPMNLACNTRKAIATEGGFGRPISANVTEMQRVAAPQHRGACGTSGKGQETAWGVSRDISPNSDGRT